MKPLTIEEWDELTLEEKYTVEELEDILEQAKEPDYPIIRERKWITKEEALMLWPKQ
jgi:hypothetical protein